MERFHDDSYKDFFHACTEILLNHDTELKSSQHSKTENNYVFDDEKKFESMVNTQRASLESWRDTKPANKDPKATKAEQNQKITLGEIALQVLKRQYAIHVLNISSTLDEAVLKMAIAFGESQGMSILDKVKTKNNRAVAMIQI